MRFARPAVAISFMLMLVASPAVRAEVVGDIRIGSVGAGWDVAAQPGGELVFKQVLDGSGHLCAMTVAPSRLLIGEPAADYAQQWKALVAPELNVPTPRQRALRAGWIALSGDRTGKRSDGQFRLYGLYTVTNGLRVQSIMASANDERCPALLKTLMATVKVNDVPTDTEAAANAGAAARREGAATESRPSPSTPTYEAPPPASPSNAMNAMNGSNAPSDAARRPADATTAFPRITGQGLFLALNKNGTVAEFGDDSALPFGDGSERRNMTYKTPHLLPGVAGVVDLAANDDHALLAMADGSVQGWGEQCSATGTYDDRVQIVYAPTRVSGVSGVAQVFVGQHFSGAITRGGKVVVWGERYNGRLAIGDYRGISADASGSQCTRPQLLPISDVASVAVSTDHVLGLLRSGTLVAWGRNTRGELGVGDAAEHLHPVAVPGLADIVQIAAGDGRSYALQRDGRLWQWGEGIGPTPQVVKGLGKTTAVWASRAYALALQSDGKVLGWGEAYGGVLGDGSFDHAYPKPVRSGLTGPFAAVYATQGAVFAWQPDGTLIGFGAHGFTPPGSPRKGHSVVPEPLLKWEAPDRWTFAVRQTGAAREGAVKR